MSLARSRSLGLLCVLSAVVGCEPGEPEPLPPAQYVLDDGTVLDVDGRGAISLSTADGRALEGTAANAFPTVHHFTDRVSVLFGFFDFRRREETEHPARRFTGSEREGDGVVLHFESDDGVEIDQRISVGTAGVSTRITTAARLEEGSTVPSIASLALPMRCDAEASFAGFGAQYNSTDQRGEAFELWVQEQGVGRDGTSPISGDEHTTYFPMPWWIDWRGFGVLIDTPERTLVDLCARDPEIAWVEVEGDAPIEMLVFHGPSTPAIVDALGAELGRPSEPPSWAWLPWIAVQGGSDAVRAEVAALEAAEIPFSALWVQDWIGGRMFSPTIYDLTYRWVADETLYPDLAGLVSELRTDHDVRFLAYNNPFVIEDLDHYATMEAERTLIQRDGETYGFQVTFSPGSMADLTNPAAVDYIQGYLRAQVLDYGFDGWMADFGEWLPTDTDLFSGEDARSVHNLYPALWHHTSREVMDELRPDGDWVIFSRSGWLRDHAEAQVVWIGDQEADFEPEDGLPTVVPALLNLGLSGIPYVTHDIAGYSGGPSSRELFFRWVELGAFTPIFRTHEGLQAAENWHWDRDAETTAHFRRFARIHAALVPEIEVLAGDAATTSMPLLRHLAMVFPDDVGSRAISDEMMLGETLLVAPVVTEGATSRSVYLPPGTWFHVFTGERFEGGTHDVAAPLGTPPVFSRDTDRPELRAIE